MLKFLTLNGIEITAICGIIAVLLTSCKPTMAVDVSGEIQRNLLIGSGKDIQGQFIIGYTKFGHSDVDFEVAPALADEVNLRTRLSVKAESTKLDSDAIFDMPKLISCFQPSFLPMTMCPIFKSKQWLITNRLVLCM